VDWLMQGIALGGNFRLEIPDVLDSGAVRILRTCKETNQRLNFIVFSAYSCVSTVIQIVFSNSPDI
jgi:hypothetical protein